MPGTYTEDEVRSVRINIPDTEAIYGEGADEYIFEDSDISLFLDQAQGSPTWAAGLAMVAIGNSEALIGKVIRNYETETDASKLQKEWRTAGMEMIKFGKSLVDADSEGFFVSAFPEWDAARHPEGYTHGSYRAPTPYQW